jgi:hypothetical protein
MLASEGLREVRPLDSQALGVRAEMRNLAEGSGNQSEAETSMARGNTEAIRSLLGWTSQP